MSIVKIFAERLKALRAEKNISMRQLGKVVGLDHKSIWQYENGISEPKQETLIKLADYFGVTTDYLLGRVDI